MHVREKVRIHGRAETRIIVKGARGRAVVIYIGALRSVYNCTSDGRPLRERKEIVRVFFGERAAAVNKVVVVHGARFFRDRDVVVSVNEVKFGNY